MPIGLPWDGYYHPTRSLWVFPISCGGHTHRVVIEHGRIRLPDHPTLDGALFGALLGRKSLPPCVKCLLAIRYRTYKWTHDRATLPSGLTITYRSIPTRLLDQLRQFRRQRESLAASSHNTNWREQLRDTAAARYFQPFCEPLRALRFHPTIQTATLPPTITLGVIDTPILFRQHGSWLLNPTPLYNHSDPCQRTSPSEFTCRICHSTHIASDNSQWWKDAELHCHTPTHHHAVDTLLHAAIAAWEKPVVWQPSTPILETAA